MLEPHAANQPLGQLVLGLRNGGSMLEGGEKMLTEREGTGRSALGEERCRHQRQPLQSGSPPLHAAAAGGMPPPPPHAHTCPSTSGARSTTRLVMAPTTRLVTLLATVLLVMSTSTWYRGREAQGSGRAGRGG